MQEGNKETRCVWDAPRSLIRPLTDLSSETVRCKTVRVQVAHPSDNNRVRRWGASLTQVSKQPNKKVRGLSEDAETSGKNIRGKSGGGRKA